ISSADAKHSHGQNKVVSREASGAQKGVDIYYLWRSVTTNSLANLMSDIATNRFRESRIGCVASLVLPAPAEYWKLDAATGYSLNILSDLPIELIGIDPSFATLEKARATRAALVCACAESIPFQARSFDLIFCINAFHQFTDPNKFLRNNRLLLRNGGRLAVFGLDP